MAWVVIKSAQLDMSVISMETDTLPGPVKATMNFSIHRAIRVTDTPGVYFAYELKKRVKDVPVFDFLQEACAAYPDAQVVTKVNDA